MYIKFSFNCHLIVLFNLNNWPDKMSCSCRLDFALLFFFKEATTITFFKKKNIHKNENWKEENKNLQQCFTSIFQKKKNENEIRRWGETEALVRRWRRGGLCTEVVRWWGGETMKHQWGGECCTNLVRRRLTVVVVKAVGCGQWSEVAKMMVKVTDWELDRRERWRGGREGGGETTWPLRLGFEILGEAFVFLSVFFVVLQVNLIIFGLIHK
jgi:hypothetical protein